MSTNIGGNGRFLEPKLQLTTKAKVENNKEKDELSRANSEQQREPQKQEPELKPQVQASALDIMANNNQAMLAINRGINRALVNNNIIPNNTGIIFNDTEPKVRFKAAAAGEKNETTPDFKTTFPSDISFISMCVSLKNQGYSLDIDSVTKDEKTGNYTFTFTKEGEDPITITLLKGDDIEIFKDMGIEVFFRDEKIMEYDGESFSGKSFIRTCKEIINAGFEINYAGMKKNNDGTFTVEFKKGDKTVSISVNGKDAEKYLKTAIAETYEDDDHTAIVSIDYWRDGKVMRITADILDELGNTVKTIKTKYDQDGNVTYTEEYTYDETGKSVTLVKVLDKNNKQIFNHAPKVESGQYAISEVKEIDGLLWVQDVIYDESGIAIGVDFTSYDKQGNEKINYTFRAGEGEHVAKNNWGSILSQYHNGPLKICVSAYSSDNKPSRDFHTYYDKDGNKTEVYQITYKDNKRVQYTETMYDENGNIKYIEYQDPAHQQLCKIYSSELAQFLFDNGDSGSISQSLLTALIEILKAQNIEYSNKDGKIEFTVDKKTFTYTIEEST